MHLFKYLGYSILLAIILACHKISDIDFLNAKKSQALTTRRRQYYSDEDYSCKNIKDTKVYNGQKLFVKWVVDGDTVKGCLLPDGKAKIKIRVLGIDCPESKANRKCHRDAARLATTCAKQVKLGKKAKRQASKYLQNKIITLQSDKDGLVKKDVFDRYLAYLHLPNGDDFGYKMIKKGLCDDYSWKYPHPRQEYYKLAANKR